MVIVYLRIPGEMQDVVYILVLRFVYTLYKFSFFIYCFRRVLNAAEMSLFEFGKIMCFGMSGTQAF